MTSEELITIVNNILGNDRTETNTELSRQDAAIAKLKLPSTNCEYVRKYGREKGLEKLIKMVQEARKPSNRWRGRGKGLR